MGNCGNQTSNTASQNQGSHYDTDLEESNSAEGHLAQQDADDVVVEEDNSDDEIPRENYHKQISKIFRDIATEMLEIKLTKLVYTFKTK
jgi:hypothetical protein